MDEWMDEWMDGWMDGWMDELPLRYLFSQLLLLLEAPGLQSKTCMNCPFFILDRIVLSPGKFARGVTRKLSQEQKRQRWKKWWEQAMTLWSEDIKNKVELVKQRQLLQDQHRLHLHQAAPKLDLFEGIPVVPAAPPPSMAM